jgi:hypothetical protein
MEAKQMNLFSGFLPSLVSYAPVYQTASVAGLCCPACGSRQENDLQVLHPCLHLACVYDQEAQEFSYQSEAFKARLAQHGIDLTGELDAHALTQLGYGDELLALDLTRAGCWSRELFAFDFEARL